MIFSSSYLFSSSIQVHTGSQSTFKLTFAPIGKNVYHKRSMTIIILDSLKVPPIELLDTFFVIWVR